MHLHIIQILPFQTVWWHSWGCSGRGCYSCSPPLPIRQVPLCKTARLWETSPALHAPRHTHTQADGGQELPSLSVDFEMEFAILNRAKSTHTHTHNGMATWNVTVKLLLPRLIPHSSPPHFWIKAFLRCRGSMSTAVCQFQKNALQDCELRL